MQITVDYDDYVSILAYVRMLARQLAPALEADLPALLGRRTPSGLRRVADAAQAGRLHAGVPRDMLPIIADACAMAIEDGGLAPGSPANGSRSVGPMAGSSGPGAKPRSTPTRRGA